MKAKELIQAGPSGVRNNPTMMAEYKRIFFDLFHYEPECPTCGSVRDWNLFQSFVNGETFTKPPIIMSDKTFELINNSIIYSYDYEDKKLKRLNRKRVYGNLMTEQFAEEYLTHGTPEQIEKRKTEFRILPEKFRDREADRFTGPKESASKKDSSEKEYRDIKEKSESTTKAKSQAAAKKKEK